MRKVGGGAPLACRGAGRANAGLRPPTPIILSTSTTYNVTTMQLIDAALAAINVLKPNEKHVYS